jgi:hypothetical protein
VLVILDEITILAGISIYRAIHINHGHVTTFLKRLFYLNANERTHKETQLK